MKIGFFGNNNNYPLLLAEAMRRAGHEVLFVVNKRELLNRPESRDPAGYGGGLPGWMIDAVDRSEWDVISLQPSLGPILDKLAACDALVLNDLGPSLLPLLDRPAISFLTGSDLGYYCRRDLPDLRLSGSSAEYQAGAAGRAHRRLLEDFVERQRQGLRASAGVNWAVPGLMPAEDALLVECGVRSEQVFNMQMADLERIQPALPPDREVLRIFCGSRLTWKLPVAAGRSTLDYKGTDVLVRGVREYWRTTGKRVELCLVRKGLHVAETEALVAAEGIGDQVVWFEEMTLQQLWREFAASDVVAEQLGPGIVSMVALDAMACGRPVIGNTRPEIPNPFSSPDSPLCHAQAPAEVCAHLRRLLDPAERRRVGAAGRAFVEATFNPARKAEICLERLTAASGPLQARSRLLAALSEAREQALFADSQLQELRAALEKQPLTGDDPQRREQERLASLVMAMRAGRRNVIWRDLVGFAGDGGRAFTVELPDLEPQADCDEKARSPLLLFEDDRLLGPGHCQHDDIRKHGAGRYSHWRRRLYFAASDGSDPNRNGRRYAIAMIVADGRKSASG